MILSHTVTNNRQKQVTIYEKANIIKNESRFI